MRMTVLQIANESKKLPLLPDQKRGEVYREAFEAARLQLDPEDSANIDEILRKFDKNSMMLKIKGLGRGGVMELLGSVGIMLADLPDKQFERMLQQRRNRL